MGLGEPLAPVIASTTPVLELIAAEAPTSPDHRGEATELGGAAADEVKSVQGGKRNCTRRFRFWQIGRPGINYSRRSDAAGSVAEDLSCAISFSRPSHDVVRL
ncbi:MAG: hypothetical protein WBC87_11950, partial [Pseudolabrys sp.]